MLGEVIHELAKRWAGREGINKEDGRWKDGGNGWKTRGAWGENRNWYQSGGDVRVEAL